MSVTPPVVVIDGIEYPLDAYPSATIATMEFDYLHSVEEQVEELEQRGWTPEDSVTQVHREWQKTQALVNGTIARAYVVGKTDSGIVGFADDRDPVAHAWVEGRDGDLSRNDDLCDRLEWLLQRGGNVVWVRRDDTGDGIMLRQTVYMVAFTDAGVEASFVKRFPEVAA
jgi:hypothetical protein